MWTCPPRVHSERMLKRTYCEGEYTHEKNLSTIQEKASQQARVPQEDENAGRSGCFEQKKKQGSEEAHRYGKELRTRLRREQRLRDSERIREVLRIGFRLQKAPYIVQWAPNGLSYARLVVIAGRRCGAAHQRNRWRRQVREAFRRAFQESKAGVDIVVRIKTRNTGSSGVSLYWKLMESFQEISRRTEYE